MKTAGNYFAQRLSNKPCCSRCRVHRQHGFTLIELVIIIVVLGILAVVAIPKLGSITNSSKIAATKDELAMLKRALVGNPHAISAGQYIDRGFEGDVGYLPSALVDLVKKPDSISSYNKISRIGWNGPYADSSGGAYLTDAWGNSYVYQRSLRRLVSSGGGSDSLAVTF